MIFRIHFRLLVFVILAVFTFGTATITKPDALLAATKKSGKQQGAKKNGSQEAGKQDSTLPWPENLMAVLGDGAVLVVDHHAPKGKKELFAYNAEKQYVPASILKIVTSGAALEFLGPNYRFKTDFLLTKEHDLWIVGYGDPYLVSEELSSIIKTLQDKGLKKVRNIYIDSSFFQRGLVLDGNTQTRSPYDAYNGGFGVNFNTLSFKKNKNGTVSRVSKHIPLTPLAKEIAAKTKGAGNYCLNISESPFVAELHSGQVFKAQLEEAGIPVSGEIFAGHEAPKKRKVFYRHQSSKTLEALVKDLMKYSNNFMTNQIFLTMGAELYGAPATLEKSQKAMDAYFKLHSLQPIMMGDGSGLSRQTTLTARQMAEILKVVEADRFLFSERDNGRIFFKTGTMSDIKTLAGYIERPDDTKRPVSFVILLNGDQYKSQDRDKILDLLRSEFMSAPSAGGR